MNGFKAASFPKKKPTGKIGKYPRLELPPEVLEMIFVHSGNLLELTLVCLTFNDVISKSPLLMRRLRVIWPDSPMQTLCLFKSNRKYERLLLRTRDPNGWQQVKYFVEKHKRTLIDLEIDWFCRLEPSQHFECLSTLSENLKILNASGLSEKIASMGVLEFLKLEELTWKTDNELMLPAFKTPKLRKFSQYGYNELEPLNLATIHRNATLSFLRDQPQLQNLEILTDSYVEAFFEAVGISPFSFSLASFKTHTDFRNQNLFPFLETQRQSLKVLSLGSISSGLEVGLRKILTLELEELELITDKYPSIGTSIVQNKTIKKLTLTIINSHFLNSKRCVSFIGSCPNVETLSLQCFKISKALSSAIASKLTKLKNLSLTSCSFNFQPSETDRYPGLETFSAKYVDRKVGESFVAANPQLRGIKICSATTSENLDQVFQGNLCF